MLCELGNTRTARDGAGGCDRPWGAELSSQEHVDSALHTRLLRRPLSEPVSVPWDCSCSRLLMAHRESSKQILLFLFPSDFLEIRYFRKTNAGRRETL